MTTLAQWIATGLVPTSGLISWHQFQSGTDGYNIAYDKSGNGRNLSCSSSGQPGLVGNVVGGKTAWYFDGTSNPLVWGTSLPLPVKHAYILASTAETPFTTNRGLVSGVATGDILTSNASGTTFFDLSGSYADFIYHKSDVLYANASMASPQNGLFELMEVSSATGIAMDGIQVGQQRGLTARKWKGYFAMLLLYDHVLTTADQLRVKMFANLYYSLNKTTALPIYFPSDDIVPIKRRRFYAAPPDYGKITDSWEYEDGGKDFNEVADTASRSWDYDYRLNNQNAPTDPVEMPIFDTFYDNVRLSRSFNFNDKYGTTFTGVRVQSYDRTHQKHMPWDQDVKFKLVKFN